MNIWKIILGVLKVYGQDEVEKALARALKRTTPQRWDELRVAFHEASSASGDRDAERVAEELAMVLFGIKP